MYAHHMNLMNVIDTAQARLLYYLFTGHGPELSAGTRFFQFQNNNMMHAPIYVTQQPKIR